MKQLCSTIARHLARGEALVLISLAAQQGSVPRTAGARMLVLANGRFSGTVGGGRYEAEALEQAALIHARAGRAGTPAHGPIHGPTHGSPNGMLLRYALQGVSDMDMVCGGSLTLLLEYIAPGQANAPAFSQGAEAEARGEDFALVAAIHFPEPRQDAGPAYITRRFVPAVWDGPESAPGEPGVSLPPAVLERLRQSNAPELFLPPGAAAPLYLLEPFPAPFRLIIFGAGHVSAALAALALTVHFTVLVADDRPEFANPQRFPGARTDVLPGLAEEQAHAYLAALRPGPRDAIAVITRGHAFDRDALAASLRTRAGYIGMIGSKAKREAVYRSLLEQGLPGPALEAVRSPIGLAIGADTPEEIAVSIAAELIAWRHDRSKAPSNGKTNDKTNGPSNGKANAQSNGRTREQAREPRP